MIRMRNAIVSILIASLLLSFINLPVSAEDVNCADTTTTGITQLECEALVALYNSTNGPGWANNDNWLTNSAVSTWHGVTVSSGHVSGMLNLSSNTLSGSIPPEVGNLAYVTYFYFPDNQLTGKIPPEFANVAGLWYLYLYGNQLTGEIPAQLFSLLNIKDIVLSDNQLSGQIPAEIGNALTLKRFMVSNNNLTGELPVGIGNLTSLTHFAVDGNDLFGPLPTGMAGWSTSMSLFSIGFNGFWTTDATLLTYLDTVSPSWDTAMSSQALIPSHKDVVGWGKLADSVDFSPELVFSKFYFRTGNAATKYKVHIFKEDDTLILAEEQTDAQACPSEGSDVAAVCTFVPQWSDFTEPLTPGKYFWAVYTFDGSGWAWMDKYHDFEIAEPPVVNYPTNTTTRVNPTFKWAPVTGAERYNLVVLDSISHLVLDHSFANDYCDLTMCVYALSTAELNLANGSYTWKVRADMGGGDYTDWGSATFSKVAAPTTKQPSVANTMPSPKFTWAPVVGQTRYQVQLYTSAGVKKMDRTVDTSICTATLCTYVPSPALTLANGAYKWKVRAGDAVEWGTYSAFKTFNKVNPPAGVSPTGTITATNPTFKWKKITGVNKYYLELRKASGVLVKAVTISSPTCTTYTCTYTFAQTLNLAKGDYKWHVKAYHGYYGPYGAYMAFKKQ